ncbi:MAG: hypothetical protein H6971_03695 [Gammaproteobacteria bacterium]|nr:hypothetical protein [Gammaproteobacteria bacterium]
MSFGHALYYPHIHLNNKNWLKHAFLFWDKISRIVPYSVNPSDNEDVIKIRYDTNFIEDYSPDRWVVSDTFRSFSEFLEKFIHSHEFYHHFRRHRRHPDWELERMHQRRFHDDLEFRRGYLQSITQSQGTYLHIQKLDMRLKEQLFELGLAVPGENEWEDWVKIDNEIGYLYMSYLAKTISKQESLPIVTDIEQFFAASSSFEFKIYRDYHAEFEYKLGNIVVASFLPKDINSIPFDKLIEIREKYSDERNAYFNTISELCQSIPEVDTESALQDALNHYSKTLITQTNDLKSSFETNRVETVVKFVSISVPTSLVSLNSFVPVKYQSLGIGAGILFGLAASINSVKKEKKQLRENPLSYLLSVNSELSGDGLLRRITDSANGIRRW